MTSGRAGVATHIPEPHADPPMMLLSQHIETGD
jgi:hypothetical protein